MAVIKPTKSEIATIDKCVELFDKHKDRFEQLAKALVGQLMIHPDLAKLIHFIKYRIKDSGHLRKKLVKKTLERKAALLQKQKKIPKQITADNLFRVVNDLAGIRLIHLHSEQFEAIHNAILEVFDEQKYELVEDPTGNCWDPAADGIYKKLGLKTSITAGYSSVHYVVRANTKTEVTCELQVRTLTDEVWGEVSHRVDYPEKSPSILAPGQLTTLARFTTGCTLLVDAIFASDAEARKRAGKGRGRTGRRKQGPTKGAADK